jgi:glycosyltransferase involved in cell wall biosynthesis
VHDLGFLILPPALNQRRVFNTYYRWAVARSVHSADAVLADSESTSHDLQRLLRVPADKITVVHLGVDEQFRLPAEGPPAIDGRYVLSVSTHPRRKTSRAAWRLLQLSGQATSTSATWWLAPWIANKGMTSGSRQRAWSQRASRSVRIRH